MSVDMVVASNVQPSSCSELRCEMTSRSYNTATDDTERLAALWNYIAPHFFVEVEKGPHETVARYANTYIYIYILVYSFIYLCIWSLTSFKVNLGEGRKSDGQTSL